MKMKEVDQVNKQNERIKGVEDSLKQAEKKRNELQKHLGELQENQDNMLPAIRSLRFIYICQYSIMILQYFVTSILGLKCSPVSIHTLVLLFLAITRLKKVSVLPKTQG